MAKFYKVKKTLTFSTKSHHQEYGKLNRSYITLGYCRREQLCNEAIHSFV